MKLYIAILDEVPPFIVPTLVAHSVINAHEKFKDIPVYQEWWHNSFKKCTVKVNQKEFSKIQQLPFIHEGYENSTLGGKTSCIVVLPCYNDVLPNVLKFAKLWKP